MYSVNGSDGQPVALRLCPVCLAVVPRYKDAEPLSWEQQAEHMVTNLPLRPDNEESLVVGYAAVVEFYQELLPATPAFWVAEIGCGRGSMLEALRRRGCAVIGTEPVATLRENARRRYHFSPEELWDLEGFEFIRQVRARGIQVQTVFLWHVLEHVPAPLALLRAVAVEWPSVEAIVLQVPLPVARYLYPEHLVFFSEETMVFIADHLGFRVARRDYDFNLEFCAYTLVRQRAQ
jgi:SAM-dependent methyltransferase